MYKFLTKNGQTIAFGVGALIVVLFYVLVVSSGDYGVFSDMDMDGVKDPKRYGFSLFDFGLGASLALVVIASLVMLAFGFFQIITDIKGSLGGLIGLAVIAIIFAIGYSMTEVETSGMVHKAAQKFELTDNVRKIIGGSITTGAALVALATLGIVVSEIRNFFK